MPFASGSSAAELLWSPPPDVLERTELGRYFRWLERDRGLRLAAYDDLYSWSVTDLEGFWSSLWEFFEVKGRARGGRVLASHDMPGAEWFPGALLNYAEHAVGGESDRQRVAIRGRSQTRPPLDLTFGELREQVARARTGLHELGVGPGDRVVAYLPNVPETVVAFLATASLGAIWASCAPEFGARAVVDRFAQIEPKVLLAVSGYVYGDKPIDRGGETAAIRERLPTLAATVHVPYGAFAAAPAGSLGWSDLLAGDGELAFDPVPFSHPLYILFSSGTTGLPKAIVHGHGGILLEHLKLMGLMWDLRPEDRFFWATTTAWMMWNVLASALLLGTEIVTFDGNPAHPDARALWRLAEETRATFFGTSPAAISGWRAQGVEPAREFDLSTVRQVGTAGSPLPAESYRWIADQFGADVLLTNGTGGTDVCTAFMCGDLPSAGLGGRDLRARPRRRRAGLRRSRPTCGGPGR